MSDWESICKGCALCCHEKIVTSDFLLIDPTRPCEFLDECSNRCSIYQERLSKNGRCRKVTPFMAAFSHSLPPECGYVEYMRSHHLRFVKERPFILSSIENAE